MSSNIRAKFCTNTMLSPCMSLTIHGNSSICNTFLSDFWKSNIRIAYSLLLAFTMKKVLLPSSLKALMGSV